MDILQGKTVNTQALSRKEKQNKAQYDVMRKFQEIEEKKKQKKKVEQAKPSPVFISQTREALYQSSALKDRYPSFWHYKPLLDAIKPKTPCFSIPHHNYQDNWNQRANSPDFLDAKWPKKWTHVQTPNFN